MKNIHLYPHLYLSWNSIYISNYPSIAIKKTIPSKSSLVFPNEWKQHGLGSRNQSRPHRSVGHQTSLEGSPGPLHQEFPGSPISSSSENDHWMIEMYIHLYYLFQFNESNLWIVLDSCFYHMDSLKVWEWWREIPAENLLPNWRSSYFKPSSLIANVPQVSGGAMSPVMTVWIDMEVSEVMGVLPNHPNLTSLESKFTAISISIFIHIYIHRDLYLSLYI